jgi:hypothetical protein
MHRRGGDVRNAQRARTNLAPKLASKAVWSLTKDDLRVWRDSLREKMSPASVNRVITTLRAALNLAAEDGAGRIHNREAWKAGLKAVGGGTKARNVILSESEVRAIVGAAYRDSEQFGLLVEVLAVTGAHQPGAEFTRQ